MMFGMPTVKKCTITANINVKNVTILKKVFNGDTENIKRLKQQNSERYFA